MSKHTPGPWRIDIEETWPADAPCFITAYSGGPLCMVDNREDARLIAAAPELLEALEVVEPVIDAMTASVEPGRMIRAAIAKARGEE